MDKTGVMKKWSKQLHDASYKAKIYHRELKSRFPDCNLSKKLQKAAENIDRSRLPTSGPIIEVPKLVEKSFLAQTKLYEWYLKCVPYTVDLSPAEFSTAFYKFLGDDSLFFGCGDILFPKGWKFGFFAPGQLEDLLLHLFNNHTYLACIVCAKKSSFSRNKRRIAFTIQQSIVFFFTAVNFSLITAGLPLWSAYVINLLAVAPIAPIMNAITTQLLVCPFLEDEDYRKNHPRLTKVVESAGFTIAVCFMITGLGSLLVASLFSTGDNQSGIILQYFLTVHLYGFFLEIYNAVKKNASKIYVSLHFFPNFISFVENKTYLAALSGPITGSLKCFEAGQRLVQLTALGEQIKVTDFSSCNFLFKLELLVESETADYYSIFRCFTARGAIEVIDTSSNPIVWNNPLEKTVKEGL